MDYIKQIIDETDYYIVIIKGRYGSIGDDGVSYTEKECRYALEKGIPILAFLYQNVADLRVGETDQDSKKQEKLKRFRNELEEKRMESYWSGVESLVSQVAEAVHGAVRRDPRVGWVRGDQAMDMAVFRDLEKSRQKIAQLEQALENTTIGDISFPSHLARGADIVEIDYKIFRKGEHTAVGDSVLKISWDEILSILVGALYKESSESYISQLICEYISERLELEEENFSNDFNINIDEMHIQAIRFQFEALGVVTAFAQKVNLTALASYTQLCWKLTEKCRRYVANLKAARRMT